MPSFFPAGKPEDFRSSVAKGSQLVYYGVTLGDVLWVKPYDFCNSGAKMRYLAKQGTF